MSAQLTIIGLRGVPMVQPGDDLAAITLAAYAATGVAPEDGDVLVVAQKIVSKAEGRIVDVATVEPSPQAIALAAEVDKDPRFVEVVLSESRRIVRHRPNLMIVEHRLGFVMANAGIDHSNVAPDDGSASGCCCCRSTPTPRPKRCGSELAARTGKRIAVIISDSFGRPWRRGTVGIALGAAGLPAVIDWRGQPDLFGRKLEVTETGFADEIAAAASLVMGQADEAMPMVLVRGLALVGARRARRRAGPARRARPVPMSAIATVRCWRCRAASAAPSWRSASTASCRPDTLTVVANTGDDFEHLGLSISPDIDTLLYTLSGSDNPELGWGRRGETWTFMAALEALGGETWFRLGDGDLATHVERTRRLAAGESLSAIIDDFRRRLGIARAAPADVRRPRAHPAAHRARAGSTSRIISCGCAASRWFRDRLRRRRRRARRIRISSPRSPTAICARS